MWQQSTLTDDAGGIKSYLSDHGIAFSLLDIEDLQSDLGGGVHRGSGYDGATFLSLSANLETLFGWRGGVIGFSAGETRGHGVSQFDTGNLLTVSNIETQPDTRIFDLYLEQSLLDQQLTLRAGQMLPSDEFASSHYAAALINSSFTWSALLGTDIPGQDPVSVLSTPALWAKFDGGGAVSGEIGLYEGTSSSQTGPLEARQSTSDGAGVLVFAETAYTIRPTADGPLPAVFKLGGWYHSAEFDDLAVGRSGASLALAGGAAYRHAGDYGVYGVADKMFYSVAGTADQGIGGFVRVAAAPDDRNLISLYVDAGLNAKGLVPGRASDNLALGLAWARASQGVTQYDGVIHGAYPDYPVRDAETVVELTYQAAVAPWWTLQPDIQYVIHPNLGAEDPATPAVAQRIPDALVLGLRTLVKF